MAERLQKILSQYGIASRRHAEALILAGRVQLNGRVAQLGDCADFPRDSIAVDGKPLQPSHRPEFTYLLLNKPTGIICTCADTYQRPTVLELLPPQLRQGQGIHPVGRLDFNSSGALLLTNDGELTLRLTHPRYHLPKTYLVWIEGHPAETALKRWREGVMLMGKKTLPAEIAVLKRRPHDTLLQVTLTEGRNRQIRRLVEQLGWKVRKLHRTAIGSIQLHPPGCARLPSGHYRSLTQAEVDFLKRCTFLATD
jgi:23S rRNA pseudouridine2605 synthase